MDVSLAQNQEFSWLRAGHFSFYGLYQSYSANPAFLRGTFYDRTQSEFAERYNIPFRTIQNWEAGVRKPPEYVVALLESRIQSDLYNRKTRTLPKHDAHKKELSKRRDHVGAISWLKAVRECLGDSFVFALDEALMCQGSFGGRSDESIVWSYKTEKEYLCVRDGEERGLTASEFKAAQADGWEKQYPYYVDKKKKEYLPPSEAEARGLERQTQEKPSRRDRSR